MRRIVMKRQRKDVFMTEIVEYLKIIITIHQYLDDRLMTTAEVVECLKISIHRYLDDRLMTTAEVADYLRVDTVTIHRYIGKGEIPVLKVGGEWRFRKGEIDEWLSTQDVVDIISKRANRRGNDYIINLIDKWLAKQAA